VSHIAFITVSSDVPPAHDDSLTKGRIRTTNDRKAGDFRGHLNGVAILRKSLGFWQYT